MPQEWHEYDTDTAFYDFRNFIGPNKSNSALSFQSVCDTHKYIPQITAVTFVMIINGGQCGSHYLPILTVANLSNLSHRTTVLLWARIQMGLFHRHLAVPSQAMLCWFAFPLPVQPCRTAPSHLRWTASRAGPKPLSRLRWRLADLNQTITTPPKKSVCFDTQLMSVQKTKEKDVFKLSVLL